MLLSIAPAIEGETEWLTVDGPRKSALEEIGAEVHTVPTFDLDHFNIANPLRSVALALKLRPRRIITTGAGVVFTFTFFSWLLGADVVYIETMARVSAPSKTGAVLAMLSSLHVVQWPELKGRFPQAVVCRPALLPDEVNMQHGGKGTFVSLGTHPEPFDRLLELVDNALAQGVLPEPCFVQGSTSRKSPRMVSADTLSTTDFQRRLRESRYVVGHAGAGFISGALSQGKRPLILARRQSFGEHVDDHQLQLAAKLAELGLVVNLGDAVDADIVKAASAPLRYEDIFSSYPSVSQTLTGYLSGAATSAASARDRLTSALARWRRQRRPRV